MAAQSAQGPTAHSGVAATPGRGEIIRVTPRLSFVGVHLFAHWLAQHAMFDPVVVQLQQAITAHRQSHPGEDFALLHHREATLRRRFVALFFAPLFGIEHTSPSSTPRSIRCRPCWGGAITARR